MKDDFQIPNLGQSPDSYDVGFFNRFARNIEMTMQTFRSKGRGIFSDVQTDQIEVTGPATFGGTNTYAGDQTFAATVTVNGALNVIGDAQVGGTFIGADVQASTLEVSGASTLNATSATTLSTSGAATLASAVITGAGTVGGSPIRTAATSKWETIVDGTIASTSGAYILTGLGAYKELRITGYLTPTTADTFTLVVTTNNGTSWISSPWQQNLKYVVSTAPTTMSVGSLTTGTFLNLTYGNVIAATGANIYGLNVNLTLHAFNKARYCTFFNDTTWVTSGGGAYVLWGEDQGYANDQSARNGIKISTGSLNAFTGDLLIEGAIG